MEENKNEFQEKADTKPYNYDNHLNELLKEILSYNKNDGLDKFEELSLYIKKKMTKLSFQYYIPKVVFKNNIDCTEYEQTLLV